MEGILLLPELELADVGGGATLQVVKRQHGGAKAPTGKKKRGRKKSAQAATFDRQVEARSKLSYKEKKSMLDSCSRPQEEMSLREFEEEMQEEGVDWIQEAKAIEEEKKYRKEIEKYKVPLYGNLKPYEKPDDSVRLMSMNVNCLSL